MKINESVYFLIIQWTKQNYVTQLSVNIAFEKIQRKIAMSINEIYVYNFMNINKIMFN